VPIYAGRIEHKGKKIRIKDSFSYIERLGPVASSNSKLIPKLNAVGSRKDSLDGGSARRKAANYTGQHEHRINTQTSMPRVGFEPTIPVLERPKTTMPATVILRYFAFVSEMFNEI
jgi:hypothetical protein